MSFAPAPSRPLLPLLRSSRLARWLLPCLGLLAAARPLAAQSPGTQDTSFASVLVDSTFYALLLNNAPATGDVAADTFNETVIAGGDRANFDQLISTGLTVDPNFMPVIFGSAGRIVYTAVPQTIVTDATVTPPATAPTILVGGQFGRTAAQVNANQPGQNILRFNADGTADTSFNPGLGANGFVAAILPQPDGSIVVGGEFSQFNGSDHVRLVRLTVGGAVDPSFSTALNFDAVVLTLALQNNPATGQPNGQILVGGAFGNVGTAARTKLARLNADGSVDAGFNPNFDARVTVVACQPDGKILVGGDFLNVNGKPASHFVRLNPDGTTDAAFAASVSTEPSGFNDPPAVYVINLLPDGRMFLGGNFAKINGVTRNFLGRVNADGTLDGFDPGNTLTGPVQSLAIQRDNRLLVGLTRTIANNGVRAPTLVRLFGDPAPATDLAPVAPTPVVPPAPSSVSITASVAMATRAQPGQLLFTRPASNAALAVNIRVKAGTRGLADYLLAPATGQPFKLGASRVFTVTFQPGAATASVGIKPTRAFSLIFNGAPETIRFTLQPDLAASPAYTINGGGKVFVTLERRQP